MGKAPRHTPRDVGAGGGSPEASRNTAVEVEEASGAPEVSVPWWPKAALRHSRGGGSLALACLAASAVLRFSPGLGSWGHFLLITALFSLISCPVADLAPVELRRNCVALSWLWNSPVVGPLVQKLLLVDEDSSLRALSQVVSLWVMRGRKGGAGV